MTMGEITVSIVSHGHGELVSGLLSDLSVCPEVGHVILTINIPEPEIGDLDRDWVSVVNNRAPQGFGCNHNAAFAQVRTPYFVVLNPDVRLCGNPFPTLLACMEMADAALCAPAVVNPAGGVEDSARYFPTLVNMIMKALRIHDGRLHYSLGDSPMLAPWVAGMFMLFRHDDYAAITGFDEGFFLYYEDVDICARLSRLGRNVMLCPTSRVVHDARRASRRDLRHMTWHARSMARYFRKHLLHAVW